MPGVSTPPVIVLAFAAAANPTYIQNPIPVPASGSPGRASYTIGFPPETSVPPEAGGTAPFIQDFNGLLNALSANIVALTGGQYWQFNAAWASQNSGYAIGAIVAMANGSGFWVNQVAGNQQNPDTTAAALSGWVPLISVGTGATIAQVGGTLTLPATSASYPYIFVAGTLTSNLRLVFPPWLRRWTIINNTSGLFTLSVGNTTSTSNILIPQGGVNNPVDVYCDGSAMHALYSPLNTICLIKLGNASVISNTTPAPDTQLITPYLPGGLYSFTAKLFVSAQSGSGTNPGANLNVSTNASLATGVGYYDGRITGATVRSNAIVGTTIGGSFDPVSVSASVDYLTISGSLHLNAPGQIYVSWAQEASSALALQLLEGSTLNVNSQQG